MLLLLRCHVWTGPHDWLFLCRNQPVCIGVGITSSSLWTQSLFVQIKSEGKAMSAMSTTNWDPFMTSPWPVEAGFELFTPLGNPSVCTFLPVNIGPHSIQLNRCCGSSFFDQSLLMSFCHQVAPRFFCDFSTFGVFTLHRHFSWGFTVAKAVFLPKVKTVYSPNFIRRRDSNSCPLASKHGALDRSTIGKARIYSV